MDHFNVQIERGTSDNDALDYSIKWSSSLKTRKRGLQFNEEKIIQSVFRPFVVNYFYADPHLSDRLTENHSISFGKGLVRRNPCIYFVAGSRLDFCAFASDRPVNYALLSLDPVQFVPRSRYDSAGNRADNITDWALEQFRTQYATALPAITKDAIFHYVYGVLHDPVYREKYALNLKREFPRIPFYPDFWRWADWGETLMQLHVRYESVEPWPLERIDTPDERSRKAGLPPKALLRANKEAGVIQLDTETQLTGVPAEAWTYRLGNRSALEWILDQYK